MSAKKNNLEKYFIPCCGTAVVDCSLKNTHRYCKLCNKLFDTPFHCLRHFASSHLSRAVQYKGTPCFPCKKEHNQVGKTDRAHFYCPDCYKTVFHRQRFIKHLKTHSTEPTPTAAVERDERRLGMLKATTGLTMKTFPIQQTKQKRQVAKEVVMRAVMRKNLARSQNVGEIIPLQRPFVRSLCIPKALPDIAGKCITQR